MGRRGANSGAGVGAMRCECECGCGVGTVCFMLRSAALYFTLL